MKFIFFIIMFLFSINSNKNITYIESPSSLSSSSNINYEENSNNYRYKTYVDGKIMIDDSYINNGFVKIFYKGNNEKVKLRITKNEKIYTYDLHKKLINEDDCVFSFTEGSGEYTIEIFESVDISKNTYKSIFKTLYNVNIDDFSPFLLSTQMVNFNNFENMPSLLTMNELIKIQETLKFVINRLEYDYEKAENIKSGYLTNLNEVYFNKKGICLDYACFMASILRKNNIPCKVEFGYVDGVYHAWVRVYVREKGEIYKNIISNGNEWILIDPTFIDSNSIKKNNDYIIKYLY